MIGSLPQAKFRATCRALLAATSCRSLAGKRTLFLCRYGSASFGLRSLLASPRGPETAPAAPRPPLILGLPGRLRRVDDLLARPELRLQRLDPLAQRVDPGTLRGDGGLGSVR